MQVMDQEEFERQEGIERAIDLEGAILDASGHGSGSNRFIDGSGSSRRSDSWKKQRSDRSGSI